jgi:putative flippase GtrA
MEARASLAALHRRDHKLPGKLQFFNNLTATGIAARRAWLKRVSGPAMALLRHLSDRLVARWRQRTLSLKAISFALVGVINAAVDYGVFFLALGLLNRSATVQSLAEAVASSCNCLSAATWIIIPANVIAWLVAVSGSYVMNSLTTFAVESGRKLTWRAYGKFVASGIAGVTANTTTVVIAVYFVPVWVAKLIAVFVGYVVNFSLSHLVVFRPRKQDASAG